MSSILFLVEGEKSEVQLYEKLKRFFLQCNPKKNCCISYGADIYQLYEALRKDEYLETIGVLKEQLIKREDKENLKLLESNEFDEIFLFFDLEPQSPKFSISKIKKIISFLIMKQP